LVGCLAKNSRCYSKQGEQQGGNVFFHLGKSISNMVPKGNDFLQNSQHLTPLMAGC
jgi:hypothetical protein